jgi:hypothetical protein
MDNTARPGIRETSQVRSLLKKSFHALEPIPALDLGQQHAPRVNLVTDSIEKKLALGGVATALIIATEFAKKNSLPLRNNNQGGPSQRRGLQHIDEDKRRRARCGRIVLLRSRQGRRR